MYYRFKSSHKLVRALQLKVGVTKPDWLVDTIITEELGSNKDKVHAVVKTLSGNLIAQKNDWIVKDYYGHYHIFDPDRFEGIFELDPNQPKDPESTPPKGSGKPDPNPTDPDDKDGDKDPKDPNNPDSGNGNGSGGNGSGSGNGNNGGSNPGGGNTGGGNSNVVLDSNYQMKGHVGFYTAQAVFSGFPTRGAEENPNAYNIKYISPIRIYLDYDKEKYLDMHVLVEFIMYIRISNIHNYLYDFRTTQKFTIIYKTDDYDHSNIVDELSRNEMFVTNFLTYLENNNFLIESSSSNLKGRGEVDIGDVEFIKKYGKNISLKNCKGILFSEVIQNGGSLKSNELLNKSLVIHKTYNNLKEKSLTIKLNENFFFDIYFWLKNTAHFISNNDAIRLSGLDDERSTDGIDLRVYE